MDTLSCIDEFKWLAENEPWSLAQLAGSAEIVNDPVWLSQVYEAMALSSAGFFEKLLLEGLRHERPFVREAAIVGIGQLLNASTDARAAVRTVAARDKNEAVRMVAQDVLSTL